MRLTSLYPLASDWFSARSKKFKDGSTLNSAFICLVFLLFLVSNLVNILCNSHFKIVLPMVDVVAVLNDPELPDNYVYKGTRYFYNNEILLAKLDNIYQSYESEYIGNINQIALIVVPSIEITPTLVSLELRDGKYNFSDDTIYYPEPAVTSLFKEHFRKSNAPLVAEDSQQESVVYFIQKFIYPLYHTVGGRAATEYQVDKIVIFLTILSWANFVTLVDSCLLATLGFVYLVLHKLYKRLARNEECRTGVVKANRVLLCITIPVFMVLGVSLGLQMISTTAIISRFPNPYSSLTCAFSWLQLFVFSYVFCCYLTWNNKIRKTYISGIVEGDIEPDDNEMKNLSSYQKEREIIFEHPDEEANTSSNGDPGGTSSIYDEIPHLSSDSTEVLSRNPFTPPSTSNKLNQRSFSFAAGSRTEPIINRTVRSASITGTSWVPTGPPGLINIVDSSSPSFHDDYNIYRQEHSDSIEHYQRVKKASGATQDEELTLKNSESENTTAMELEVYDKLRGRDEEGDDNERSTMQPEQESIDIGIHRSPIPRSTSRFTEEGLE